MRETLLDRQQKLEALHPNWGQLDIYHEFLQSVQKFGDTVFIWDDDGIVSYKQAYEKIKQFAVALSHQGIVKGTHVALCCEDSRKFVLISLALYSLGAVKIPIGAALGITERDYIFNQSDTEYVIVEKVVSGVVHVKQIILSELPTALIPISENNTKPEEVVDIIYTSGSTARPKGVMLTNQMLLQSAYANDYNRGIAPGRRIYIPIPLNHIFGYVEGVLGAILAGATLVFTKGHFNAEKALVCIEERKVNDILLVPSMAIKMMRSDNLEKTDLSSLYAMYCGASICSESVWKEIKIRFGIEELVTGYGMTELAGATMQNLPGDGVSVLKKSLGKLMQYRSTGDNKFWIQYKIVDSVTGKELPLGKMGDVICKGAMVTPGYYKNPQANAVAFTEDGWLKTEDIGCFDKNGYFEFAGRSHEQCKVNGENVSLKYLDEIIGNCSAVCAVETVAVPDVVSGEAVMAFVESNSNLAEVKKSIITYSRNHLAVYQMPKYFCFEKRDQWPQTSSMKVQKYQLAKIAEAMIRKNPEKYKADRY